MRAHQLGARGEALAVRFLERRGWRIVARNVRFRRKEIDIVATRGPVLAFVEVKARRGTEFGHPLEAITALKRREIRMVAEAWLQDVEVTPSVIRFDAVSILWSGEGQPRIEHIEDAWRLG